MNHLELLSATLLLEIAAWCRSQEDTLSKITDGEFSSEDPMRLRLLRDRSAFLATEAEALSILNSRKS